MDGLEKEKQNEYTSENLLKDMIKWTTWFSIFSATRHIIWWTANNDYATNWKKRNPTMRDVIPTSQLQLFSTVGTQRFKFLNQLIFISIRSMRSRCSYCSFLYSVAVILALDIPQSR
jgi:uncharacterized membrane protein